MKLTPNQVKVGDLISVDTAIRVTDLSNFTIAGQLPDGTALSWYMQALGQEGRSITLLDRPLPDEPAVGSIVVDRSGEVWQRRDTGGSQPWAGLHARYTTWEKLNAYQGPLEILPRVGVPA